MQTRRLFLRLFGTLPFVGVGAARAAIPRAPVLVLRTRVMGTAYYEAEESVATLAPGALLPMRREADNPYDSRAIELFDPRGRKLGYVARIDNPAVARMMDAGETFVARVARLDAAALAIDAEIHWVPR